MLRLAPGVSRRANSLNPMVPTAAANEETIAAASVVLRREGLPLLFRITDLIDPAVDAALEQRGFTAEGRTKTLYADIGALPATPHPDVQIYPGPEQTWLDEMSRLQEHSPQQRGAYASVVRSIAGPAAFLRLPAGDETAALTYAAVSEGIACVESVIAAPEHRGKGHARRLLEAAFAWAAANGATGVCLQVEASNAPGLALYERLGLKRDLYGYHYRRAPQPV